MSMDGDRQIAQDPNQTDRPDPLFEIPDALAEQSQLVHAAAIVIGRTGIVLRGGTGSGKSLLQRYICQRAQDSGLFSCLISDDYVRLARPMTSPTSSKSQRQEKGEALKPAPLLAFGPSATRGLQEVYGLGIVAQRQDQFTSPVACPVEPVAVIHLIVDLLPQEDIPRSPDAEHLSTSLSGVAMPHLMVPERSAIEAADRIFAQLSTSPL